VVDVRDVLSAKRRAINAYRSQSHLQAADHATVDSVASEMFHRVFPAWSSPTAETVRLLR
jgi:LmbE family N-acetylglucosaminyl deacetylase